MIIKSFKEYLHEMAIPTEEHKKQVYYHGTSTLSAGKSIIEHGITPPDLSDRKGKLKPIDGKVYLTKNLRYAIIYCLGHADIGNDAEYDKNLDGDERYGWIFKIDGNSLIDIQPDEDSIGEILYDLLNNKNTHNYNLNNLEWLKYSAESRLTPIQLRKVKNYDDYADFAVAGKKLVKFMTDNNKLQLINQGAHIAHTGKIIPTEAWLFDKRDNPKLNKDGSNFFYIAKKYVN